MFASITDYASVYDDAYRQRRGEHTSFDRKVLPPLVAEFCAARSCRRLLDVSGGQGNLGRDLGAFGIESLTTDIGALPGSGVVPFTLSEQDDAETARILRAFDPHRGPYVTTCLDVLEHIDREHLAAAVHNLAVLSDRHLLVSISTRPSAFDNLLHATLLPIRAWIEAFAAAGFVLRQMDALPAAQSRRSFPQTEELRLINRWMAADPFADIAAGEPRYLAFERSGPVPSFAEVERAVEAVADVGYRRMKRAQFAPLPDRRINLGLHHAQEWSVLRPLLDVIPRAQARVLIRPAQIEPEMLRAIRSLLRRNGVATVEYDDAGSLPWHELKDEVLVAGAESSVNGGAHLMGHETSAVARLQGCRTYLLQHGIWPRPFPGQVVTFASARVLTWGDEEASRLHGGRHRVIEAELPWGLLPPEQDLPIGAPKFADQLLGDAPRLDLKFGHDPSLFDRVVLVGTKNLRGRWGIRNVNEAFLAELDGLIARNPRTFFILRPHPADTAESFAGLNHPNLRCFDELLGVLADMPLGRIMPGVDLVATSPSSLIADAAVSRRAVFVYDTGQPVEFADTTVAPLAKVEQAWTTEASLLPMRDFAEGFRRRYAANADEGFYARFAEALSRPAPDRLDRAAAATAALSSHAVAALRRAAAAEARAATAEAALAAALAESEAIRAERDAALAAEAAMRDAEAAARARHDAVRAENEALRGSTSWRLTAPLRRVMAGLRGGRAGG